MTCRDAAEILHRFSVLLELTEDEPFRARTYANAARLLETESDSVERLLSERRVAAMKGIGKGVEAVLVELCERGTFAALEEVERRVPPGVFDLMKVQGLGTKKAKVLWQQAKITSLEELELAIRSENPPQLPGFGAKTYEKFLAGIVFLRGMKGRHHRHFAVQEMSALRSALEKIAGIRAIHFGGSLRRGYETVGDLDVLVVAESEDVSSVRDALRSLHEVRWSATEDELWSGTTANNFPVELSVVSPETAAARLLLMTGSKDHYRGLCELAAQRGWKLSYDGLSDSAGKSLTVKNEADVYLALDLEPVPPPMRETTRTIVHRGSRTFAQPVTIQDFRGIIHNHSTYSDGLNTMREMAEAMIARGFEYLGIADHSQAAAYASGLSPQRVRAQWLEIDSLNKDLAPFRILKGTEVDILPDGTLDFPDELLAEFDYVVASIHSKFQMSDDEATNRLCRALSNPHVDILGHPTGRLLLEREGYSINHERVIQCAAEHGKAIELNCSPYRLDIDWRWLATCEELSVPVPINPDAHSIPELDHIRFGVDVAAKGPLTAANCPSTWSANEFLTWCKTRKRPN